MACWIPGPYARAWGAGKRRKQDEAKAAAAAAVAVKKKPGRKPKAQVAEETE